MIDPSPRPVQLVGGPRNGDKPIVDLVTISLTHEETGAIYERRADEIWIFDFIGYEN